MKEEKRETGGGDLVYVEGFWRGRKSAGNFVGGREKPSERKGNQKRGEINMKGGGGRIEE